MANPDPELAPVEDIPKHPFLIKSMFLVNNYQMPETFPSETPGQILFEE